MKELKAAKRPFQTEPKNPKTPFRRAGQPLPFDVLAFWQWAGSNLVSNAFRGNLAEFLVCRAVNAEGAVRATWDEVDLTTRSGTKVEVKSSAYIQDWGQSRPSRPSFDISPSRAWDKEHGHRAVDAKRHSNVYVFCLLHHLDPDTLDPLEVSQWTFYVVPTKVLELRFPRQKTLALSKLDLLDKTGEARKVPFDDVEASIDWASTFSSGV